CPITTETLFRMWRESGPLMCSKPVLRAILKKPLRKELCDENSDDFGASDSAGPPGLRSAGAERTTASPHRESHSRSADRYRAALAPRVRQLRAAARGSQFCRSGRPRSVQGRAL